MPPLLKNPMGTLSWKLAVPTIVTVLALVTFFVAGRPQIFAFMSDGSASPSSESPVFSNEFPASEDYQNEMKRLLETRELEPENEKLIREWSTAAATDMQMPPAVLWCLFFQESRLNHLQGYSTERPAKGLGQFLRPSFYEVNHQLDRYTPINSQVLVRRMGYDVRPVQAVRPKRNTAGILSSYYHIPTAVLSSAGYLNSRYHQLQRNLKTKGITYNPDLLWLYSVMAYNKGTRSVLSLWKEARRKGGEAKVQSLVTDFAAFEAAIQRKPTVERALAKIWPKDQAQRYANEVRVHIKNISRCAMKPRPAPDRDIATTKEGSIQ